MTDTTKRGSWKRCDMVCAHRDQCTLMLGHDPGHNFRVCDCNGPLLPLAEVAAFDALFDALQDALSVADTETLVRVHMRGDYAWFKPS